ncbi:immune inhibitor A domain-containing protein [Actinophytocola algeriensis]|uniref:Immune inhibitor A n=1 Tax=Actinophytocola algeriensis TaxID=1768010 RepID=A0A7W7Q694_9PSEU|nr:immune inhibitor A domain-containing protein [Actinophytocola algeriensis]MBB4907466.1 immune inhibitor A [Actinophytocola algeriensis]MBE1479496.1 immune inhibitor A [Actinophytocola algeriensis]
MKKFAVGALSSAAVAAVLAAVLPGAVDASPARDTAQASTPAAHREDNRPGPLTKQRNEMRKQAIEKVATGKAKPDTEGVVELEPGKFVETTTVRQDKIFTILAEFGDQSSGRYGTVPGPLHNEIPEPDRTVDNSTEWAPDFDKAFYEEHFNGDGESMRTYYEALSNGRYSVTNTVTDWVKVPYNASWYGDNAREDNGGSWDFIQDSGNAWWDSQLAAGRTPAEIDAYLAQFDVWDRNDWDHDGNFDEADGYLDHFQAVHAGEGEDAGGGAQGEDAIWSHRWYVNGDDYGLTGPQVGGTQNKAGGARIGGSKYWLGDYTTEPENGGLGVFCHEFGHDLGLPDFYDTAGGENSTAFWTLMSSGSWLGHGAAAGDGIGTHPGLMGAEEKLFLGWLDHSTVNLGSSGDYTLNPAQLQVDGKDQAVRVNLPDKTASTSYTTPASGTHAWWTGSADDLNQSLTRDVPAASRITVNASAWYSIEADYDFLVGEYSLDGGANWARAGALVDGDSAGKWTSLKFSYDAGGKASQFRFRFQSDGGVHLPGAFLDDITVKSGGTTLFSDNVESGTNGWTPQGLWKISTGTETGTFEQYYLVENREYVGSDALLAEGPYQFSKGLTAPNWVEFFKFQNGMLVWYVDGSYGDNNVSEHPGAGSAMVVDARPAPFSWSDGTRPSNRRQPFDATFGLEATDETCLHKEVLTGKGQQQTVTTLAACAPSVPGIPVFDDTNPDAYYSTANPQGSVKVAGHGVQVTVTGDAGDDLTISVVNPAG